jgi:L-amino acid N-acyltransferase YncA
MLVDVSSQRVYHGENWDSYSVEEREAYLKSRASEFQVNCETGFSFVAELEGRVVGFLFGYENLPYGDELVIRHVAVEPEYQGQVVGKMLLTALVEKAASENRRAIRSWISNDNSKSMRLHESVGFEMTDWIRAYLKVEHNP